MRRTALPHAPLDLDPVYEIEPRTPSLGAQGMVDNAAEDPAIAAGSIGLRYDGDDVAAHAKQNRLALDSGMTVPFGAARRLAIG